MDLRIVNTCNNNCAYCLEQSLRVKESFIKKEVIFGLLEEEGDKEVLSFFGGNPLLHPNLLEIITFAKLTGFRNISLLSNTLGLSQYFIDDLFQSGLKNIGVYFNSINEVKHRLIVGKEGIGLDVLLQNIKFLVLKGIQVKIIIHINYQNIQNIHKDVAILSRKYGISSFEFVNYFPFDRPYDVYKNILEYSVIQNIGSILQLFKVIKKLQLQTNFVKFSKDFFGTHLNFYNLKSGILEQIGDEDKEVLEASEKPYCLIEGRCDMCFLKDCCKWYKNNINSV